MVLIQHLTHLTNMRRTKWGPILAEQTQKIRMWTIRQLEDTLETYGENVEQDAHDQLLTGWIRTPRSMNTDKSLTHGELDNTSEIFDYSGPTPQVGQPCTRAGGYA